MIHIIDYGVGNLGSVVNMLKKINVPCELTSSIDTIKNATKIILPGNGHFDHCMQQLRKIEGLEETLNHKATIQKIPLLGICVGCQMLTNRSEEGFEKGLGWIEGEVIRFKVDSKIYKIPHMGWADVKIHKNANLLEGMEEEESRFYFSHSYHLANCAAEHHFLSTTFGYEFLAGIAKDNIIGVQFHPEKSHKFGMQFLHNFYHNF